MVRDNRHDSAYIFGAICPQRGVGAAMITPAANTDMMNLHLAEISTQVAAGAIAVLTCDGAGWHQIGGALVVPDNIVLLHLPPYSPELNPMENVWDYLRQNKLSPWSGTATTTSSRPAKPPGTGSSQIPPGSNQSANANGRVSLFRRIGMTSTTIGVCSATRSSGSLPRAGSSRSSCIVYRVKRLDEVEIGTTVASPLP